MHVLHFQQRRCIFEMFDCMQRQVDAGFKARRFLTQSIRCYALQCFFSSIQTHTYFLIASLFFHATRPCTNSLAKAAFKNISVSYAARFPGACRTPQFVPTPDLLNTRAVSQKPPRLSSDMPSDKRGDSGLRSLPFCGEAAVNSYSTSDTNRPTAAKPASMSSRLTA